MKKNKKIITKKPFNISVAIFIMFLIIAGLVFFLYPGNSPDSPLYGYKVINTFPHDGAAFTQGLVYENGFLYEGTGLKGLSSLRKVELDTGKVLQKIDLPAEYFGEGITIFDNKIIQLTYQSRVGFVYDKKTFELLRQFDYPTEGWGLTHDGEHLIMSDGSPTLYFLDPQSFEVVSRLAVYYGNNLLSNLNELEYINGRIYANVWATDNIVVIDPRAGQVTNVIDLTGLLSAEESRTAEVLNGIAYDQKNKRLFVTGKLWPKLFEIKLVPKK